MKAAIRDDNPVVYLHHYMLTLVPGEVPDGDHVVPIGLAGVKRAGNDVTIVATGWMMQHALSAAEQLAAEGIQAEVVDPRTLAPLDTATILRSVEKTGRVVLVDQAPRHASVTALIAAEIAEAGFHALKAPPSWSPRWTIRCRTASRSRSRCCRASRRSSRRCAACSQGDSSPLPQSAVALRRSMRHLPERRGARPIHFEMGPRERTGMLSVTTRNGLAARAC